MRWGVVMINSEFDKLCKKLSVKASTDLLCQHVNGRAIYNITKPTQKQCDVLKVGNFPFMRWGSSDQWEIKSGADVTGDVSDNRILLIKTGR